MKKIATTLTLAFAAILAASQSASAQEAEGFRPQARFNFPANYYKMEQPNAPKEHSAYVPPTTVRVGHVPTGGLMGGLDPTFLKPAPPPPAPVVRTAATPSFGKPVPVASATPLAAPPAFSNKFGIPGPALGALPQPKAATPTAPARTAAKPTPTLIVHHSYGNNVHGHLITPHLPVGQHATPVVASYGPDQGYKSGTYVPSSGGSGNSSSTSLQGTILPRHK